LNDIGQLIVRVAVDVSKLTAHPGETMSGWFDDDDEHEEVDEEGDESEEESEDDDDEGNSDASVEAAFREERAKVRASNDQPDLRQKRRNLQGALDAEKLHGLNAARARDLVELIDDRIAELRARQMADRLR
jgi:hypothetical protein